MGRAELIEDPRFGSIAARSEHVDALYATLTEGMRLRTTAEWLEILRAADIPCGAANTLQDLMSNAYLRETGFFKEMQHPVEGKVVLPAIAPRVLRQPAERAALVAGAWRAYRGGAAGDRIDRVGYRRGHGHGRMIAPRSE